MRQIPSLVVLNAHDGPQLPFPTQTSSERWEAPGDSTQNSNTPMGKSWDWFLFIWTRGLAFTLLCLYCNPIHAEDVYSDYNGHFSSLFAEHADGCLFFLRLSCYFPPPMEWQWCYFKQKLILVVKRFISVRPTIHSCSQHTDLQTPGFWKDRTFLAKDWGQGWWGNSASKDKTLSYHPLPPWAPPLPKAESLTNWQTLNFRVAQPFYLQLLSTLPAFSKYLCFPSRGHI